MYAKYNYFCRTVHYKQGQNLKKCPQIGECLFLSYINVKHPEVILITLPTKCNNAVQY